jgi:hypothetical protein
MAKLKYFTLGTKLFIEISLTTFHYLDNHPLIRGELSGVKTLGFMLQGNIYINSWQLPLQALTRQLCCIRIIFQKILMSLRMVNSLLIYFSEH